MISQTWIQEKETQVALLDELSKIGESQQESNKQRVLRALKTVGLAATGSAIGEGAYQLAKHKSPKFEAFLKAKKPHTRRAVRLATIGIPTLTALGLILGSRYRQKLDEGLSPKPTPNARRT